MAVLDLDFVRHRPAWPAWLMLAVGVALAIDTGVRYQGLQHELVQLQRRGAKPQFAAPAPKAPVTEKTQREVDAARHILGELMLPWDALFRSIEESIGADAALLAIEPDAAKRVVRISGEARSYLAILNLMLRLESQQMLTGVHLVQHLIREDVAERPYQFTLAASWREQP
jgi:Tfp pilus assembly protein PilN